MHTFKKGDEVHILNSTIGGRFFVEGRGMIVGVVPDIDEQYRVVLAGEVYERFVDPMAQNDPEAFVATLNERPYGSP